MSALARTSGASGAYFEMVIEQPNNSTWDEVYYFMEGGAPMVLTGLSFKMTFRASDADTSACYTLSTGDGTLTVAADPISGIENNLNVNVAKGSLSGLCGDYVCDLASEDANGKVDAWAHGVASFRPLPVSF